MMAKALDYSSSCL